MIRTYCDNPACGKEIPSGKRGDAMDVRSIQLSPTVSASVRIELFRAGRAQNPDLCGDCAPGLLAAALAAATNPDQDARIGAPEEAF